MSWNNNSGVRNDEKCDRGVMATNFPPSIMWYNTHGADGRKDMFAYVSLNRIVIGRVNQDNLWPDFSMIIQREDFSCISLEKCDWPDLTIKDSPIATGDAAGRVRVWNVVDKSFLEHYGHEKSGPRVVDVKRSGRTASLIYSVDKNGGICIWNLKTQALRSMKLGAKWDICCIAVSQCSQDVVALGENGGNILIVSVESDSPQTLYKMYHDQGLIDVQWVPDKDWDGADMKLEHIGPLLVSTIQSKAEGIYVAVWDSQGQLVSQLCHHDGRDIKIGARVQEKNFVPISWITSPITGKRELFLACKGIVGAWRRIRFQETHSLHKDPLVFAIIQTEDVMWSFGREAMIVGWNLRSFQTQCIVPTMGGVCYIQPSIADGSTVAVGGTDGVLRIISMPKGYPRERCDQTPTLTIPARAMQYKITCMAWNPVKEDLIAIGTDIGAVALFNYGGDSRFTKLFDNRLKGPIYAVEWGPEVYTRDHYARLTTNNEEQESEKADGCEVFGSKMKQVQQFTLYALANYRVSYVRVGKTSNEFRGINGIIQSTNEEYKSDLRTSKVTEMKWCPEKQFLCLGYFDGRIDIFMIPLLELRCTIRCHTKAIQYLSWRPYDFGGSKSLSKWLASASNDGLIKLYNLAKLYEETNLMQVSQAGVTLDGHKAVRVISMAWSSFIPEYLVTVSYDWSAVVWNAMEGCPIARLQGHHQRLVACLFHPSEPNQIIICSDEILYETHFAMRIWNFKDHPCTSSSSVTKDKVMELVESIKQERVNKEVEAQELPKLVMVCRENVVTERKYVAESVEIEKEFGNLKTNDVQNPSEEDLDLLTSVIPVKQICKDNIKKHINLLENLTDGTPGGSLSHLTTIGKENSALLIDTVKEKVDCFINAGRWLEAVCLSHWISCSSYVVKEAILRETVTQPVADLVLLGNFPASDRQEVQRLYVKALRAKGKVNEALSYLLSCNAVMEAMELLVSCKRFEEASAMISCYFTGPLKNELMSSVKKSWIHQLLDAGEFPGAIYLLCVCEDYEQAYTVIETWHELEGWHVGLDIAKRHGNSPKVVHFGQLCIQNMVMLGFHDKAVDVALEVKELEVLAPFIVIHEWILNVTNCEKEDESVDFRNIIDTPLATMMKEKFKVESFRPLMRDFLQTLLPQTKEEAMLLLGKHYTLKWACVSNEKDQKSTERLCAQFCDPKFFRILDRAFESCFQGI